MMAESWPFRTRFRTQRLNALTLKQGLLLSDVYESQSIEIKAVKSYLRIVDQSKKRSCSYREKYHLDYS